jgi:3-dehydro-L-gulonate 2-dehydrogenase
MYIASGSNQIIRIPYDQMKSEFSGILVKAGFSDLKAEKCAEIFAKNSLEGVYSHGVNRFPRFVMNVRDGYIIPDAEPAIVCSSGSLEQWDGNLGPGPLNAALATRRATELAEKNGIGLVAMANTNHWMRGGAYGWQAAGKGFVFIGWTNTEANMPAWGAYDARLGNNPFVIAVPFGKEAVVLDFAMTQFSYGKMETYKREGKRLPFPGGFNDTGELTDDPEQILRTRRTLPIGNWKGSGLSLLLDILATILSGGRSTNEITKSKVEYSVSQVFIAICLKRLHNCSSIESSVHQIIDNLKSSIPENEQARIRYPGENIVKTRNLNLKSGIPVNRELWNEIRDL